MRKRIFVIIVLILTMIVSTFTGCAGESETLQICVDMAYVSGGGNSGLNAAMYDLEYSLREYDGLTNFEFEFIPTDGPERETALDRIRTEIMAGSGPDVFMISCAGAASIPYGDALFLLPEKAMETGLFLPLDAYMENNTQHTEWDKMTKVIMDAGRNEEGQILIPLTYTVPVLMYPEEDMQHAPSAEMTWQDMLADEALYDAAARIGDGLNMPWEYDGKPTFGLDLHIDYMLGDLADYEAEKLSFTEEELLQHMNEIFELRKYTQETDPYSEKGWNEGFMGHGMNGSDRLAFELNGIKERDNFTLVPLYSDDGGATAIILNYLAVNRNTQRPEDAFKFIDRMMKLETQQRAPIYLQALYQSVTGQCMPMHEDLMRESCPIKMNTFAHNNTYFSEENFETVCAVRENITNVQFASELNVILQEMSIECDKAYTNGEDYTEIVSKAYNTMRQMMAE